MAGGPEAAAAEPLHVVIEFLRQQNPEDPHAFRFEPQTYLMRGLGGSYEASEFAWDQSVLSELSALRLPGRDAVLCQRLGDRLRRFLLPMEWSVSEAEIVRAVQSRRRVLVTIRSAAAELYSLPWELVTIKASGRHLGALSGVLVRYEWPGLGVVEAAAQRPGEDGRILFCWSAAGGAVPAAAHQRAIQQAATEGSFPFDPARDVLGNVTLEDLVKRLKQATTEGPPVSVLHLLCHGGVQGQTYGLILNSESEGTESWVDAGRLRDVLSDFAGMVQLVVLAACDSGNPGALGNHLGSVAQTLHRAGFKAVLASRYPLSVSGSVRLIEPIYRELLVDLRSLEEAVVSARSSMVLDTAQSDWAGLQLYARPPAHEESGTRPLVFRPYRGLLAFQPEHRRFFFGREREIVELVGDFRALRDSGSPRLLAVDGASGTGKSSVLFAGALPQLVSSMGEGAGFARMRPGRAPLEELDRAFAAREGASPFLLICDQFEELFTHVEDPAIRQSFARRLWELATGAGSGVFIVLTIRSDYVGRCGELVLDGEGLRLDRVIYNEGHRVSIAQMSVPQMRQVITGPARRVGLRLEPGLAERLLTDVEAEPGALPLLSDTLDLLWQRRVGSVLTQAAYDELGGVTGALQGRADALIDALDAEEQRTARRFVVRLVNVDEEQRTGTRRRVDLATLRPADPEQGARFDRVLGRLLAARLLVLGQERERAQVEVAHEALLRRWPRLIKWVQADRKLLAELDKIEDWVTEWRERGTLLSGNQLGYAAEVERSHGEELSDDARALLRVSAEERSRADERDRYARDTLRVLAAEDMSLDPTRAAAILREVESRDPRLIRGWLPLALEILQRHVLTLVELRGHTGPVLGVAFSADGRQVITGSLDRTVRAWSADGSSDPKVLYERGSQPFRGVLNRTGTRMVQYEDEALLLYSLSDGVPPLLLCTLSGPMRQMVFSPDDRFFAAAGGHTIWIWDLTKDQEVLELRGQNEDNPVTALAFSTDSRQVVAGYASGLIQLWTCDGVPGPSLQLPGPDEIRSLFVRPDGPEGPRLVVFRDGWTGFRVFDLETQQLVVTNDNMMLASGMMVSSPGGEKLAIGMGPVQIVDPAGRGVALYCAGARSSVLSAAFSPDGRRLVTGDEEGVVRIWDLTREHLCHATALGPLPQKDRSEPETDSDLTVQLLGRELELAQDGLSVSVVPEENRKLVWHLAEGQREFVRPQESVHQESAWSSPDGTWKMVPFADGRLDLQGQDGSGRPIEVTVCPPGGGSFRFSPDSRHLLIVQEGVGPALWRLDGSIAQSRPLVLAPPDGVVTFTTFSSDGSRIFIASRRAQIFRTDGETCAVLVDPQQPLDVRYAAFAPDGEHLLTIETARFRFWSMSGKKVPFLTSTFEQEPIAVDSAWKKLLTRPGSAPAAVWELDVDPESILRRLWLATPFCLSVEERQLLLSEPRELALKNFERSRERIRRCGDCTFRDVPQ